MFYAANRSSNLVCTLSGAGGCCLPADADLGTCLLVSCLQQILPQVVPPWQPLLLLCAAIATPSAASTASQIRSAQPWTRQPSSKMTMIWKMKQQWWQQQQQQGGHCQPVQAG
jgi:hypothetical protein